MKSNKFTQAQIEVRRIKLGLSSNSYQYQEITPKKASIGPTLVTLLFSFVSIVGVLASLYFLV